MPTQDKPDLCDASDTDDVYRLAYDLAAWGLRNRECTEDDAVDWVLGHPHAEKLPRGSRGSLNPTKHHITNGAKKAVAKYDPTIRGKGSYDPDPLHELAARIAGSGVTHERYLLAVISLCFKNETYTPVVTGTLLSELVGVNESSACDVLRIWSETLAYGFFTGRPTFDGETGHGRVWSVNVGWLPTSKPKHLPGCNRSKARCQCPGMSQTALAIIAAAKDSWGKVRHFESWLATLKSGTGVSITDVCVNTGMTRYEAKKQLEAAEGTLLKTGTFAGGRVRRRGADGKFRWVNQGQTWFVA